MIIGAPIIAIVLPTGSGEGKTCEKISANRDTPAPTRSVTGIVLMWTEDPAMALEMWGATIPTNPKGPQNAVTAPVMRQLPIIETFLVLDGLTPTRAEYSSPKRATSNLRLFIKAMTKPAERADRIISIPLYPVPTKLPADQL